MKAVAAERLKQDFVIFPANVYMSERCTGAGISVYHALQEKRDGRIGWAARHPSGALDDFPNDTPLHGHM